MGMDPATATLAVGGIGAASSLFGANKASKEAARAAEQQRAMQQQDLDFRRQMYEQERGYTQPLRERLSREALSDQPLDYARISGQIKENYANAARKFQGLGGSGLSQGAQRGMAMGQASALGDAFAQGMSGRRQLLQTALGYGQPMQAGAMYSQGLGNMAAGYGQEANMLRGAAAQGWNNFGQGISGITSYLAAQPPRQDSGTPTTTARSYANPIGDFPVPTSSVPDSGYPEFSNPYNFNMPYGGNTPSFMPATYGFKK